MVNNPPKKTLLSSSSLFATLVITLMGANFLDSPHYGAKYGGPSGYWSVIVAFVLISLVVVLIQAFQIRFPNQNLFQITPGIIGKPLSLIGNLLFLSGFLIQLILAIRDGSGLVLNYLLNRTPLWAIAFVFLLSIGYIASNGLAAIIRLINFLFLPVFIIRLGIELLSIQKIEMTHLLPLVSEPPGQYLMGGLAIAGYFFPITIVFLLSNRLKNPPKLITAIFGAVGCVFPVYLLAFIGTIGVFGVKYTLNLTWPEISTIDYISIPFLVIERLGLIFLITWITSLLATNTFYLYALASGLKQQFPILKYRLTALVLLALVIGAGMFMPNTILVHQLYTQIRPWLMVPVTAYPLFIYIIALLRGKRGNRIEA